MKKFKGRIVTPGTVTAKAVVTKEGFNTLASMQMALQFGDKSVKCGDQNNADIYGKTLAGKALCLPQTIGSTTGGLVLYCACALKTYPACMLFSNHIDPKKSLVFSSSGSFCLILLQAKNLCAKLRFLIENCLIYIRIFLFDIKYLKIYIKYSIIYWLRRKF